MLRQLWIICALAITQLGLYGCSNTSVPSTSVAAMNDSVKNELIEGFFVAPGVNFAHYNKVIVTDLTLDDIAIQLSKTTKEQPPITLSAEDKQFYRSQYVAAVINNLIADGAYTTSIDVGHDVLLLRAAIVNMSPPAPKAKSHSLSDIQAYAEKLSAVTIAIEIYDSQTQQLLATLTDTRQLGNVWEEGNRLSHNNQVQLAFDYWLGYVRVELNELSVR